MPSVRTIKAPFQYRMRLVIRHENLDLEKISWVLRQITQYQVIRAGEVEENPFHSTAKITVWDGILHSEPYLVGDIDEPHTQLTELLEKLQAYQTIFTALGAEGAEMQLRCEVYSRQEAAFTIPPRLMMIAAALQLEFSMRFFPHAAGE